MTVRKTALTAAMKATAHNHQQQHQQQQRHQHLRNRMATPIRAHAPLSCLCVTITTVYLSGGGAIDWMTVVTLVMNEAVFIVVIVVT